MDKFVVLIKLILLISQQRLQIFNVISKELLVIIIFIYYNWLINLIHTKYIIIIYYYKYKQCLVIQIII